MAKVTTAVHFAINSLINRFMGETEKRELGETFTSLAKDMISKGISPVRGHRKFESYNAQNTGKKGYPYNIMRQYASKRARPVNLYLSGSMLNGYSWRSKPGQLIEVGYVNVSGVDAIKAQVHNDGTRNIPARPTVANKPGQQFAVAIMRELISVYRKRLEDIIKKSNK